MAGFFVAFEGTEGSGKTTQAERLAAVLRDSGYDVVGTREPGGTAVGERIRQILLDSEEPAILPATEALLYAAARAQHVGDVIAPALARGAVVVCDRFVDSSLAYQAGGSELPLDAVKAIQPLAVAGVEPNVRLLFDLPVELGLARRLAAGEINRLDAADVEFHRRVQAMYHRLVAECPGDWVTIDATAPVDEVARAVTTVVAARLPALGGRRS